MQIELPTDIFTYPDVPLPDVWTVEQIYGTPALTVEQVAHQARQAVESLLQGTSLQPGATVAVGVGSRGLDNLVSTVRAVRRRCCTATASRRKPWGRRFALP